MHDVLIIGAGHNGLTCAHYLARKGLGVAVLEAADKVGGAAVTDEFAPGFRNSAASYTVSLLQPKVIRDMGLERHGLKVVLRKTDNFLPGPKGQYLLAGRDGLTRSELVRHHPADGAAYDRYHHDLVPIEGIDCSDCVLVLEHGVGRLNGVLAVNVNYASQKMRVEFDAEQTTRAAIEQRVRGLGYAVPAEALGL